MLRPQLSKSKLQLWKKHAGLPILCVFVAFLIAAPLAAGQGTTEFTLTATDFSPDAVAPGGTSSSVLSIGSVNSFAGTVNLSCQVTSGQVTTTSPPVCNISPTSVVPPATATATITTTGTTTTIGYTITITGTGPTTTYTTPALQLTVLSVTPQFTITIQSAVAPSSVVAGSGAQGTISINPINGYTSPTDPSDPTKSGIYLSCATITPLVTIAPVCSFNPPNPKVVSQSVTSTITISTFGPVVVGSAVRPHVFYGLWLSLPMLAFVGLGAAVGGKRSRKACALLTIFIVSGSLLLIPACGTNTNQISIPNGTTPANTYTFTIAGVDINGVISSNTGSTTTTGTGTGTTTTNTGPSVSLAVTAPHAQ